VKKAHLRRSLPRERQGHDCVAAPHHRSVVTPVTTNVMGAASDTGRPVLTSRSSRRHRMSCIQVFLNSPGHSTPAAATLRQTAESGK
jgi:hypothetical protein